MSLGFHHHFINFLVCWQWDQDVDMIFLRGGGIIRIQVAVLSMKMFKKMTLVLLRSLQGFTSSSTDDFRFMLEEDDFVPDDDFIPCIWEHHDDGPNNGASRDEDMPNRDAHKRAKNALVSGNNSSGIGVGTIVLMENCYRLRRPLACRVGTPGMGGIQFVGSELPPSHLDVSMATSTPESSLRSAWLLSALSLEMTVHPLPAQPLATGLARPVLHRPYYPRLGMQFSPSRRPVAFPRLPPLLQPTPRPAWWASLIAMVYSDISNYTDFDIVIHWAYCRSVVSGRSYV